jgi:transposase InsO family protein
LDGLKRYRKRYQKAARAERGHLLDEFCAETGYHRKYAIALLRQPVDSPPPGAKPRRRGPTYSEAAVRVLEQVWQASGYPWSVRLKAMLPLWLPWARNHVHGVTEAVEAELLAMSPRQMDRRLAPKKRKLKHRLYGRTKPGTLLKTQIPVKTDNWDIHEPGYCELDLVSHSGPHAAGEFIYSLNLTDIHSGWCETRAIMGKSEANVVEALEDIRRHLPFRLKAIDTDNGSEFINHHLVGYCKEQGIVFVRGRPYKKDDNAHIEQKNWTHVRKLLGWERYDTPEALEAINALYRGPWRAMMNLYQPCVKLKEKVRTGSRLTRRYDAPQTPLERLAASYEGQPLPKALKQLQDVQHQLDPFKLGEEIDRFIARLSKLPQAYERPKFTTLVQRTPSPRGGGEQPRNHPNTSYAR